ncbi:MAG TPA: LLM class flavin-dependent oxidoreductase [Microthrixaceae bacterium]|nr:LLM class flavin-dependent oxidoreductase [Microthrixaceae bacterium]
MKIGLSLPTMLSGLDRETVLGWCRRIEGDGYSTIGFGERIAYHNLELFSVLSAAAAVTERVRIASTIVVLPLHSAVWVAKQTATLDVLSGGRVTLGVGVGGRSEDYEAVGSPFERRFDRLDAQVASIRSLWAGEAPADGLDPVGPATVQAHIPILSGAMGPKSLARSARWADGIAGFETDPSRAALEASRDRMDRAWHEAGRTSEPYRMTSFWFAVGDDGPERLGSYARDYLGVFGPELADALAASCTAHSADAVRAAIRDAASLGFDEIQLVPTTADLGELDRLSSIVQAL